jgi:hypothetical protein
MSMPPGPPPDPSTPTAPMTPVPPTTPAFSAAPPTPAAPSDRSGLSAPAPAPPSTGGDALVLPPNSSYNVWFAKVQEVAKRSWKSALIICTIGIAAPYGVSGLVARLGEWGSGFGLFGIGSFFTALGTLLLGFFVALLVSIAGCFVAAAGWAAGTWALVQEAATGRPASIGTAFSYGTKRAMALFPWTVIAAVAFAIASACLWIPGLYIAFGFSMFGFVALFEKGQNPVARSFSLTHNSTTIGPTLGRIATLLGVASVYLWIIWAIEGALEIGLALGTHSGMGYRLGSGVIELIGGILAAPVFAMLLIGLLPTYAELRAREAPVSTPQLMASLG